MDKETVINNLLCTYEKHGVTREDLERCISNGMKEYSLSLDAIYNILRMTFASEFNEHEYFTLSDVMEVTGESAEELQERIEECREELAAEGLNPDDYFKPIEPQAVYYFPNGL